jgi:hypothetical protein
MEYQILVRHNATSPGFHRASGCRGTTDNGGVPEGVRADLVAGARVVEVGGVPADDLIDAGAGPWLVVRAEHRGLGTMWPAGRCEQRAEQRRSGATAGRSATCPFAVPADDRVLAEAEVPGAQISCILHPRAGVLHVPVTCAQVKE